MQLVRELRIRVVAIVQPLWFLATDPRARSERYAIETVTPAQDASFAAKDGGEMAQLTLVKARSNAA